MLKKQQTKKCKVNYRHLFIVVGVVFLILVFFSIYTTYKEGHPKLADIREAMEMKRLVIDLKNRVVDDRDWWTDTSACTIIRPGKIGGRFQHYCEAGFKRKLPVSSELDVKNIINNQHKKIANNESQVFAVSYPVFPMRAAEEYDVASYMIRFVKFSDIACAMSNTYELQGAQVYLLQSLRCIVNTSDAFYEPIYEVR